MYIQKREKCFFYENNIGTLFAWSSSNGKIRVYMYVSVLYFELISFLQLYQQEVSWQIDYREGCGAAGIQLAKECRGHRLRSAFMLVCTVTNRLSWRLWARRNSTYQRVLSTSSTLSIYVGKYRDKSTIVKVVGPQEFNLPKSVVDIVYAQNLCW